LRYLRYGAIFDSGDITAVENFEMKQNYRLIETVETNIWNQLGKREILELCNMRVKFATHLITFALIIWTSWHLGCSRRANFLFIMSDDHAKKAISCYHGDSANVQTPQIDRLCHEGIRFDKAFVTNSLCGPSRAVILTGKHSHINGFMKNGDKFDERQWTFPKELRANGYNTSIIGKYHLNSFPDGSFDYWSILEGQGQYYQPDFFVNETKLSRFDDVHVTDKITELALQVLKERSEEDKPWLLMMHHKAPHREWNAPSRFLGFLDGKRFDPPSNFFDDYHTRGPALRLCHNKVRELYWTSDLKLFLPKEMQDPGDGGMDGNTHPKRSYSNFLRRMNTTQREAWMRYYKPQSEMFFERNFTGKALEVEILRLFLRDYTQSIVAVDESVGKVLDFLDASRMASNTLVVYTSDQGFFLGEHGLFDKRFMYEESFGTPLIMRFPPLMKGRSHIDTETMMQNLDFAPTILELAGTRIPAEVQGESFLQALEGGEAGHSSIYYHYFEMPGSHLVRKHRGVRTKNMKLIHFYGDDIESWEMFDLEVDPQEMHNLYGLPQFKTEQDALRNELKCLSTKFGDDIYMTSMSQLVF